MRYVDVILPLPLRTVFTYSVPPDTHTTPQPGCRVVVPFGTRKIYTAVVVARHDVTPEGYEVKPIMECLDPQPVVLPSQLSLWQWISDYYMCSVGEVYKAALPSGMKLESETKVCVNPDAVEEYDLSARELQVLHLIRERKKLSISALQSPREGGGVMPVVRRLLDRGLLLLEEELRRDYKPRMEVRVTLADSLFSEERLNATLDALQQARSHRRYDLLMAYIEKAGVVAALKLQNKSLLAPVSRLELLKGTGISSNICAAMVQQGIFTLYEHEVGRLRSSGTSETIGLSPLSAAQQQALDTITSAFVHTPVCLLHGVTSSGKTEVYIHLMQQAIDQGKQVLFLVPEIVLTTQLTARLYKVFGPRMGVYHSRFSDAERVEIWARQLSDTPYDIIVGVRSSVFLPYVRLGLVIVDEEHESSYKQQEPAPRYHARSAALMLARQCGARVLLGSATPSFESYYQAQVLHKYGYVQLAQRYGQVQLPYVEVVDIKELRRKKMMEGSFSPRLIEEVQRALRAHEQVILFQNRRGYAPLVECRTCGWVPRCVNCDVSLTYHKGMGRLTCHYCGYTCAVPQRCPTCGETAFMERGFGTEKIEDEVHRLFPEAHVARMDLDTTRSRASYEAMLADFAAGRTNVLVGTQMVTKGLDFEKVSVVGILNADTLTQMPDFRSYERAFQLMSQVAGRAGRRATRGRVILQTKSADLPLIAQVTSHDYQSLFDQQMQERELFLYPPFCRLMYVYVRCRHAEGADRLATDLGNVLRAALAHRVLGPDVPNVGRVQALYIRKIMIKVGAADSWTKVKACVAQRADALLASGRYGTAQVYYDVDPV